MAGISGFVLPPHRPWRRTCAGRPNAPRGGLAPGSSVPWSNSGLSSNSKSGLCSSSSSSSSSNRGLCSSSPAEQPGSAHGAAAFRILPPPTATSAARARGEEAATWQRAPGGGRSRPSRGKWTTVARAAVGPGADAAAAALQLQVLPVEFEQAQQQEEQFVWDQAWYPVGLVEDLDPKVPCAVTILGLPLVVWWDRAWGAGGGWRVFHDLCPHRLAPLSEGRIHESGDLQCSYHGWTFQGDGACSRIPQQDPDRPQACTSKKACARVYPSRVHQGIVWFWPQLESSSGTAALADATPIPTVAALDDPSYFRVLGQYDLNYGQELLLENLMDPAHVPFAHHNVNNQGTRDEGRALDIFIKSVTKWGLEAEGLEQQGHRFTAPCLITFTTTVERVKRGKREHKERQAQAQANGASSNGASSSSNGLPSSAPVSLQERAKGFLESNDDKRVVACFWCIPRSPGRSRVIFTFAGNFLPEIARKLPRWFTHRGQLAVLESDHYMLHLLERRLQEEGGQEAAMKAYYTPTRSDALVSSYRRWLKTRAGGQVQWPSSVDPQLPPALPKERLMDRMENHVKICKSCKTAVKWMEGIATALKVLAFLSALFLVAKSALQPGRVGALFAVGMSALSGLSAAASYFLSRFVKHNYYFSDYVHALVP